MPFEDAPLRIEHMLEAIAAIQSYTRGKPFDAYRADRMLQDAVERNIERLSEASRHVPEALKRLAPAVPWREIAGIGNILRHDYDGVDDAVIWNLVRNDLEALRTALQALLSEAGGC